MTPPASIDTARLVLRASDVGLAAGVAEFYRRNRQAHARWNPPMVEAMFSAEGQADRLTESVAAAKAGSGIGWWLFSPNSPERVIGQIHFSNITRRAFQSAMLGYAIDHQHEGRGLMREALQAALADVFGPRVHLHRVQANVRPENVRSLALLACLGFEREGLARDYLFIDGAWRDHAMTALRNPHWAAGEAPAT